MADLRLTFNYTQQLEIQDHVQRNFQSSQISGEWVWGVCNHWGNIRVGHLNYGGKYLKLTVTIDLLVMKGMGMFSDFCFNIQFVNFLFFFSKSLNISYFSALSETKNQETVKKKKTNKHFPTNWYV